MATQATGTTKAAPLSMEAIHEAGHAVVAAYVRCPFLHATIKANESSGGHVCYKRPFVRQQSHNKATNTFRPRSENQQATSLIRQACKRAQATLGARAAADWYFSKEIASTYEATYRWDEQILQQASQILLLPAESFREWRDLVLSTVREIIKEPFVQAAIITIATDLQNALIKGHGISAKHVRDVLKACETAHEEQSVSVQNRPTPAILPA